MLERNKRWTVYYYSFLTASLTTKTFYMYEIRYSGAFSKVMNIN